MRIRHIVRKCRVGLPRVVNSAGRIAAVFPLSPCLTFKCLHWRVLNVTRLSVIGRYVILSPKVFSVLLILRDWYDAIRFPRAFISNSVSRYKKRLFLYASKYCLCYIDFLPLMHSVPSFSMSIFLSVRTHTGSSRDGSYGRVGHNVTSL